ncbi:MAG: hypothetical protein ABFD69_13710 [Candidatus Sumerlaeia bacterium]
MKKSAAFGLILICLFITRMVRAESAQTIKEFNRVFAQYTGSDSDSAPFEFHQEITAHQLFRGDSVTIDGITANWEFTDRDRASTSTLGRLRFTRKEQPGLPAASTSFELSGDMLVQRDGGLGLREEISFYLAPVGFEITAERDNKGISNLVLQTMLQPDRIKLTGELIGSVPLYVSRTSPVHVQQERWSISDRPKKYPDGKQIYQLEIRGGDGAMKAEIPLADGAFLEIGRFRIVVERYNVESQTARLGVLIKEDKSIKGRWGVIEANFISSWSTEKMLKTFAEPAGVRIVWEAAPGHPESVEYLKNYINPVNTSSQHRYQGTVDTIIKSITENDPARRFEWVSDTQLKVSPTDYGKVLAEQDKKAALEEENQEAVKRFDADYRLETKIYPLRAISIATAKSIVEPELHAYKLVNGRDGKYIVVQETHPWAAIEGRIARETAIADDKTNSLILKAFPKTHEKVVALLQKIDQSLAPAMSAEVPNRFQIEAILLRGDKAGTSTLPSYLSAKDLESLGVKSVTQTGRAIVSLAAEKGELGRAKATLGSSYGVELSFQDLRKPYLIVRGSLTGAIGTASAANDQVLTLDVGNQRNVSGVSGLNYLAITLDRVIEARDHDKHGDAAEIEVGTKRIEIKELETVSVPIYGIEITAESIEAEPGPHNGRARLRVRFLPESGSSRSQEPANSTMLLENTVFLEPGKPALLGLTNMREALILVLKWQQ